VNPHVEYAAAEAARWMGEYRLLDPGAARKLCAITAQGVARTYPTADADGLALAAHLFLWSVAFDDAHGEQTAAADPAAFVDRVAALLSAFEPGDGGRPTPAAGAADEPFAAALRDVLCRVRDRATDDLFLKLASNLRDTLVGMVWEAHHLAEPRRVRLRDYRAVRPHTVLAPATVTMAEVLLGHRLTAADRAAARPVEEAVFALAGALNDVASYARERALAGGAEPLSLPTLIARDQACPPEEALDRLARTCERRALDLRAALTALPGAPGTSPALAAHADALGNVVHSFAWHIAHARYAAAGGA